MEFKGPRQKGTYIYLACDFCQRRKIRCAPGSGNCQACSMRGLECTYNNPTRRNKWRSQQPAQCQWERFATSWNPSPTQPTPLRANSPSPFNPNPPPIETNIPPSIEPSTSCSDYESFESDLTEVLSPRASEITKDETKAITTTLYNNNTRTFSQIHSSLPHLVRHSSPAEFRFTIDILMASAEFHRAFHQRFQIKNPNHKMSDSALTYYARAVAYLPTIAAESELLLRPSLLLLDVIRHQATALFLAASFRVLTH
ncbi:hypothetical protein DSO57_1016467 [Entomophthora muscae]|uniref:Uncharacterized protein n=1 Tax=Entomophthora muscae TaxID=34485 RepID=A0ACC2U2R4_9FUNG|nr:hypothetical protein DSO57_1016467 [Entomophthora muscae]